MRRRSLLLAVLLGAVGPNVATSVATNPSAPNLVVIMVDDLSSSTLSDALANHWMPRLENDVIGQGLTFANFFVADSLCCPSRATFLTGQHSHNHGVRTNMPPLGGITVFEDASTLPTWLRAAGYRTGLVGKYLNGYGADLSPSPRDDQTYVPPGWDDWQALTVADQMFNYTINDNGTLVSYGSQTADYQTDVLAARAADFIIESDAGDDAQPFMLFVTPQAPHHETSVLCSLNVGAIASLPPAPRHSGVTAALFLPQPPSFNEANVGDKPAWIKGSFGLLTAAQIDCLRDGHRNRVGSMLAVDDLIGTILAALQDTGELGSTVVMFVSDNGFLLGEHRINSKQQAYEEAIRVPFYARVPGLVGPQTALQLVVNIDVAPTLVELAGAAPGLTMDGQSFVPILQDPTVGPWRSYVLIEHQKAGGKLVPPAYSAVRSAQFKWVEYATGERELYDLAVDPFELVSQHANPAYSSVKRALKAKLAVLGSCVGATCWQ